MEWRRCPINVSLELALHRCQCKSVGAELVSDPACRSLTVVVSSGNLEVTVDFLTEIDRLVQLIESPMFTCESFLV